MLQDRSGADRERRYFCISSFCYGVLKVGEGGGFDWIHGSRFREVKGVVEEAEGKELSGFEVSRKGSVC